MKRFALLISIIGVTLLMISACDKLEGPFLEPTGGGNDTVIAEKIVLLEEYTGHQCPNCPRGAIAVNNILATYGKRVVAVAVHAGFYARVSPGTPFTADYRTDAGATYDQFFGINGIIPRGMVNRTGYGSPELLLNPDEFAGKVSIALAAEPVAALQITVQYNSQTRICNISTQINFLQHITDPINLSVWIVEDSIVSPQKNAIVELGPDIIHDYVHRHVFRGAVNGTWGQVIDAQALPGTSTVLTSQITLHSSWNPNHCSIVAFVYNSETYEVLQAAEIKIIE